MNMEGKMMIKDTETVDTEEEEYLGGGGGESSTMMTKKKGGRSSSGARGLMSGAVGCQAERCAVDLSEAKRYHRRHKVCELHSKASVVHVSGLRQRFCQQCSRFHELSEFDETKRSCRRRLAGHNERRRKSMAEEASTAKEPMIITHHALLDNSNPTPSTQFKHYQIR